MKLASQKGAARVIIAHSGQAGHPIWRRDFCDERAKPLIAKARALGIEVYWHGVEGARVSQTVRPPPVFQSSTA